jgi:hypothetical protein
MKPKNREINIFNMSLLDILCGALGTFCFLTLVLFPYYRPNKNVKAPEVPPGVDPKSYDQAMARIRELEETVRKFQNYSKQLEGQVSQAQAQAKELQERLSKASEKTSQLAYRNPFIMFMSEGGGIQGDDFELYVDDTRASTDGKVHTPKLDPAKRQGSFWRGDMSFSSPTTPFHYFVLRDGPPGEYKVYCKVLKHNVAGKASTLFAGVENEFERKVSAPFYITQAAGLIPVATIKVDADYKQKVDFIIPAELTTRPADPQSDGKRRMTGSNRL